jgi:ribonuclease HI
MPPHAVLGSNTIIQQIAAILAALKYAQENLKLPESELVVFSDSQQALRAIQVGNSANSGRALLLRIAESIDTLGKTGIDVRFRWSPGYEGVVGNEEANDVAREALSREGRLIALA